jgi:hypothetical protein
MRSAVRRRLVAYRRLTERKAEQERAALQPDWMALAEGIEFVERMDARSGVEIKRSPYEQICDAIEDGELRSRWFDQTQPPRDRLGIAWIPDEPSYFVGELRKRRFRFDNGGEIHWGGRRWRQLFLSRKDMQRIFGRAETESASTTELRDLSKNEQGMKAIHEAISAVYDLAKEQGVKPPNVREMRELAPQWLRKYRGVTAAAQWIEEAACSPRYHSRRGKRGATVKGHARPISDLKI